MGQCSNLRFVTPMTFIQALPHALRPLIKGVTSTTTMVGSLCECRRCMGDGITRDLWIDGRVSALPSLPGI